MQVNVDDETMKQVVAKAIYDNLTPEAKQRLMTDALAYVLSKPEKYGSRRSPLEEAFQEEMREAGRRVAAELLAVQGSLERLSIELAQALMQFFVAIDAFKKAMAEDLARVFTRRLERHEDDQDAE